ncbi:winged helix DNA-binding domain-containing protein [Actinokineospora sp. NPDC004072]
MLTKRALNRATLHRQLLLERSDLPALAAVEHLVGMQAQEPLSPYVGLWSRLRDFKAAELADLVTTGAVLRCPFYRATIHLVSAADHGRIQPLLRTLLHRRFASSPFKSILDEVDAADLAAAATEVLAEKPRTRRELCIALGERWPDVDAEYLGVAVQFLVPVVQRPPRGVWGRTGRAEWALAPECSGEPVDLVSRYLAAFGPATVRDIQTWSGLTRLRDVVRELDLRVLTDETGRELLDLPEGPLPDEDTPAPVRFLPEFDNLLLAHHDRTRVISDEDYRRGIIIGGKCTLLVDGFVHGIWRVKDGVLDVEVFRPLTPGQRADVLAEGARLLAFAEVDGRVEIS